LPINLSSFRYINRISEWLITLSIIFVVATIITLVSASFTIIFNDSNVSFFTRIGGITDTISAGIGFIIAIITLGWFYRATKNVRTLGAKEVSSPIMAVVWWFVPIFQLWKPYKVAQQIWRASNPLINLINGTEWRNAQNSNLVKVWWVSGLVYVFMISGGLVLIIFSDAHYAGLERGDDVLTASNDYQFSSNPLRIIPIPFQVVSAIFYILVINQIATSQRLKSVS
jgi:hypothetical protein